MIARLALASALGVLAAIVLAIAIWYLSVALALALEGAGLGSAWSSLIVGAVGLVLVLVIALMIKLSVSSRRRAAAPAPASSAAGVAGIAAELGGVVAQRLTETGRAHPYKTMGSALAAGLIVGALPELRGLLAGLFKK